MNPQQGVQSRSPANGYGRRRVEKDGGSRLDNRAHTGKSRKSANSGSISGNKVSGPMRDRLVYLSTCLIGHNVEVQLKNGSVYSGIYHAMDVDREFGVILKMARMTKDGSLHQGQKASEETLSKAFSDMLIIPAKELVQVIAKDVSVTRDGLSNEQSQKPQEILIDSYISQSRHVDLERELEPWIPDEDIPQCPELENVFDGPWERGWNQFETNEALFGVKSTFNEDLYTTKLERGPQMREREREAARIAREIEGEDTRDLHLAEERGLHLHDNFDVDEETRFSSVNRGRVADDSGYEDEEDIVLDSRNTETFGAESHMHEGPSSGASAGGIGSDGAQVLSSSSSMDDAQTSQSNMTGEGHHTGHHHPAVQSSAELIPKCSGASDGENRVQVTVLSHPEGSTDTEDQTVIDVPDKETHTVKSDGIDSPSLSDLKDDHDAKGLSISASSSGPILKDHEKMGSTFDPSEGPLSRKHEETQAKDTNDRPSSSTSSTSDRPGAVSAATRPGLTPSSSVSSLSSEKSTLNPHAKEFKLNPNAKSFIPQAPVRPLSPVADGSFYFPANIPAAPHMHPVGVGMGPFMGHQPVIFNPQVAQMQSSQAYMHPNGAQYGQQMLYSGHSRHVPYIPSFQPEMPYKGRDY